MSQATLFDVEALCAGYLAAWEARDVTAILAFHTEDTAFSSPTTGRLADGKEAVAAAFHQIFAVWPDLSFKTRRLYAGAEIIVVESTASATQAVPLPIGDVLVSPNGRRIQFDLVDLFPLREGKILRKDVYFDGQAYIRAMRPLAGSAGSA